MTLSDSQETAAHARRFWAERYKTFSLSESGWMGAGEDFNRYIYKCKQQALMHALARIGVGGDSSLDVLDAGCGQGFFAGIWLNGFFRATYEGVDISADLVSHLRGTFPRGRFFCGDIATWRHPEEKRFDLIQSFEVLHLLLSDRSVELAVRNLAAQLKPGGHLLLTAAMPEVPVEPHEYIRHQSAEFWKAAFQKAGLKVNAMNRMYYWLPDGGPANRVVRKLLWLPGPGVLYTLDRCAHALRLPQVFGGWDSMTKLVILSKQ